jgi:hypothetical protein
MDEAISGSIRLCGKLKTYIRHIPGSDMRIFSRMQTPRWQRMQMRETIEVYVAGVIIRVSDANGISTMDPPPYRMRSAPWPAIALRRPATSPTAAD